MTTIGQLDATSTKAGTEPAEPEEGKVTKGVVGVGKRQTFRYKSPEVPASSTTFEHDLGTLFVTISAYTTKEGVVKPVGVASVVLVSSSELTFDTSSVGLALGDLLTLVLSA